MLSKPRKIVIGDVHGCYLELIMLLNKAGYNPTQDDLIFVGDLVNRGPDSKKVIDFIKAQNAVSILGNHEYYLLESTRLGEHQQNVYQQMKLAFKEEFDELIDYLKTWPLYLEFDDYIVVHAGIDINKSIDKTSPSFLVQVREIKNANGDSQAWFQDYNGEKTIIFGHWAKLGGLIRSNLIGLDLACVYGGSLRAVILPSREIIEVKAQKAYFTP